MEREGHAAAAAAAAYRRWEAPAEDVIVVSSGRPPRHLQQQQPSDGVVVTGQQQFVEPPEKVYYKTKLCDKYAASGRCMYEDGCTFAHGHAELRPPLPTHGRGGGGGVGGWRRPAPPEQEHAKGYGGFHGGGGGSGSGGKVCFLFRETRTCHYGDKCAFSHAFAPGPGMHNPEEPKLVEARRSTPPPARPAFPPPVASPRYASGPARAFPPVPAAAAVRDRLLQVPEEDGDKASTLTLLSRRKTSGIYGDWPEDY